jgi:hypothetical protein
VIGGGSTFGDGRGVGGQSIWVDSVVGVPFLLVKPAALELELGNG